MALRSRFDHGKTPAIPSSRGAQGRRFLNSVQEDTESFRLFTKREMSQKGIVSSIYSAAIAVSVALLHIWVLPLDVSLFSLQTPLFLGSLAVNHGVICAVRCRWWVRVSEHPNSTLGQLLAFFTHTRFLSVLLALPLSALASLWALLGLWNQHVITQETHTRLQLLGGATWYAVFLAYHMARTHDFALHFPSVQRTRLAQFKSSLIHTILESIATVAVLMTVVSAVLYLDVWFLVAPGEHDQQTYTRMLILLLNASWVFTLTLNLSRDVANIILTEAVDMGPHLLQGLSQPASGVVVGLEPDPRDTLVQYWTMLHLTRVAEFSPERRKHIFDTSDDFYLLPTAARVPTLILDSPWRWIVTPCVRLLSTMSANVYAFMEDPSHAPGHALLPGFYSLNASQRTYHLFKDVNLFVWAAQALSMLILASYHEDTTGVAQGSLEAVVSSMLELKLAVETYIRWGGFLEKEQQRKLKGHQLARPVLLEICEHLNIAIFRIVSKFSDVFVNMRDMGGPRSRKIHALLKSYCDANDK